MCTQVKYILSSYYFILNFKRFISDFVKSEQVSSSLLTSQHTLRHTVWATDTRQFV